MPDIKLTQAGARVLIVPLVSIKVTQLQARVLIVQQPNRLGAMSPGTNIAF